MRLLVVVNARDDVVAHQTTAMLIQRAAARGHEVQVAGVGDLGIDHAGRFTARARRVRQTRGTEGAVKALARAPGELVDIGDCDAWLLRTNPARDPERASAHDAALGLAAIARRRGVVVLNDPDGLMRATSKLYLSTLPAAHRPQTLVSRDGQQIRDFLRELDGPVVLKPLKGTRGRDVFLIRPDDPANVNQIIEVLTRDGYAMVQRFVPEAVEGDVRLVLLEGQLLEVDGEAAAVRRVPKGEDFRSNVHVGGHPSPVAVTDAMRSIVAAVGPQLHDDGLFLVGLDLIGDVVVEANVFATGGLMDAERFYDRDFVSPILDAVERRVANRPSTA